MSDKKQSQSAAKPATKSDQPPANLFLGTGRIGREPELRYSADGRAWCKTSLAIFQGEDKEPIWLEVKAFAKPQETGGWDERVPLAVAELKKGQKVAVRGKLYCDKRDYNGKQYVDWGLVVFTAPTVIADDRATSDTLEEGEPD